MVLGVVGILIAGVLVFRVLSSSLEGRAEEDQSSKLQLISSFLLDSSFTRLSWNDRKQILSLIGTNLQTQIVIVRKDGSVVFESPTGHPFASGTPVEERPEVIRASGGGVGHSWDGDRLSSATLLAGSPLIEVTDGFVLVATSSNSGSSRDRIGAILVWSSIAALIVLCVASLRVAKGISEPVVSIVETVDKIREGETTARITGEYPTELSELANAINRMAEKLGADITKFERLERVRSEFLGNVSHELRTPIFSLQGFLETLLDGAVDDPSVNRAFLAKAHTHAERLNTLLNDLIEISRIESGEMKMSFRYFSILEFLQGIVDELKPMAVTKGIVLYLESEFDSAAKVYGDKSRLRQVMINLIDNAIKYSDHGGNVTCIARAFRNQCEIIVRDSGKGIPPEHLSRIFERFYRVDTDRSREIGGTGLGLAIVKHIVEAHGTTIEVSSTPGKGSLFSFKLKR